MISFENSLGVLPATLQFRANRAEVIAGNISNMETPSYKAKDLNFREVFEQQISQATLPTAGNAKPGVLQLPQPDDMHSSVYERNPDKVDESGNSVELGYEQAAFMRNRMAFETSFAFLNMKFKGLERAING